MNKTKIIATIGTASKDKDVLREMIKKGMDVVRLNMSHCDYDFCEDIVSKIDSLNEELGTNVSIMVDTKGPEIRVGKFENDEATFKEGDKIRIYMDDILGDSTKFSINYPNLINEIKYNSVIRVDDGRLELEVLDKGEDFLLCEVMNDATITSGRSFNVPGLKLKRPFLTEKDREDIIFANKIKADFLALSFVNSAEDILTVNDMLIDLENDHIGILAKIENEYALEELDEIIRISDGIIVARGDLGVELPMERLPGIQKNIIAKCHNAGKVSIVATEMLSSMENEIRPTRAEVSDVANAVIDSVDAVMLSGETTIGKYPIETIAMMEKIIASAEMDINYLELLDKAMRTEKQDITGIIANSVTECASRLKASAIVAPTMSGYTAKKMSRFRPVCPIIAVSPNKETVKSLSLHFGVHAYLIDDLNSLDKIIKQSLDITNRVLRTEPGDKVIITGGYPFKNVKHTNFMKIEEL